MLPTNLCLVTLLSSDTFSQFERFRLHYVRLVNKQSIFRTTKMIDNNAEMSRIPFDV